MRLPIRTSLICSLTLIAVVVALWPAGAGAQNAPSKSNGKNAGKVAAKNSPTFHPDPWAGKPPFPLDKPWPRRDDIKRPRLSEFNRLLLNNAYQKGKTKTDVMVLSRHGHNDQICAWLTKELGAELKRRDDVVDYLRVKGVALKDVAKLVAHPDVIDFLVEATTANQNYAYNFMNHGDPTDYYYERRGALVQLTPLPTPKARPNLPVLPASEMKEINPYVPTYAIGAPQFRKEHPTYDGRGTVIATVEHGIDWLHPSLQEARDLEGNKIRKVAKVIVACDQDNEACHYRVTLGPVVTAKDGFLEDRGVRFKVAKDGEYRLGKFTHPYLTLKDGSWKSVTFDVAWSPSRKMLWADMGQTHDFSMYHAVRDYNATGDVGILTHDDPTTPINESENFALVTESGDPNVIYMVLPNSHTTGTMVAAAGHNLAGGEANGVAPGAQIVIIAGFGPKFVISEFTEGLLAAVREPSVDMVSLSTTGLDFPGDGEGFLGQIENRASEGYRKLFIQSAGNEGPSLDSLEGIESAQNVIAVGGYETAETLQSLYGGEWSAGKQFIPAFSARGISLLGLIKPDVIAPSTLLAASVCAWDRSYLQSPQSAMGKYREPSCFHPASGTSESSPVIAGGVALLVSAARQNQQKPLSAEVLKTALLQSAHGLPGYSALEEGAGLVDIPEAWKLVSERATRAEISAIDIYGPIEHPNSAYTKTPGIGAGLLVWDAWKSGDRGERVMYFVRRTGEPRALPYRLVCQGDSESFQLPASVSLPLGAPTPVSVELTANAPGFHVCLLNIIDSNGSLAARSAISLVVVAAPDESGTVEIGGAINPGQALHAFVAVPSDLAGLRLKLNNERGRVLFESVAPETSYPWREAYSHYLFPRYAHILTGTRPEGEWHESISQSPGGIWEFVLSSRDHVPENMKAGLRVQMLASQLDASSVSMTKPDTWKLTVSTNQPQYHLGGEIGRLKQQQLSTSADFMPVTANLEVPRGTKRLLVQASIPKEDRAAVSLELRNCAGKTCLIWDLLRPDSEGRMGREVLWPDAGKWQIVTAATDAVKHTVDVETAVFGPQFGQVESGKMEASHTENRQGEGSRSESRDTRSITALVYPTEVQGESVALLELVDTAATQELVERPLGDYEPKVPVPSTVVAARRLVRLESAVSSGFGSGQNF